MIFCEFKHYNAKRITRFSSPVLCLLLFSLAPVESFAGEIYGRWSSELYAWQQADNDHLRPYGRFRATWLPGKKTYDRRVSVHTNLRWTTDLLDELPSDPQLYIYGMYLDVKKAFRSTDIRLGRQFAYTGFGSVLLDGARARIKLSRKLSLNLFGGSSASRIDPEKVQSYSEFGALGGRATYTLSRSTRVGAGWLRRNTDGLLSRHVGGILADFDNGAYRASGRLSYNILNRRFSEYLARLSTRAGKWYLSAEYNQREPSVSGNSIFGIINFNNYKITRFEVNRRVGKGISVTSQIRVTYRDSSDALTFSAGLASANYSLGFRHQDGYAGENNGVYGSLNHRINQRWDIFGGADMNKYFIQEERTDKLESYSMRAGLQWKSDNNLTARFEGQFLRNAIQESDFRLLIRVSKSFAVKSKKESGSQ